MKKAFVIALICLVGIVVGNAATFEYSYKFTDGTVVTGTLDGDQTGDFVVNVHNVTVLFNGVPMGGTVFTAKYIDGTWPAGPVVSFHAINNNFLFVNSDFVAGNYNWTKEFTGVP